MRVRYQITAALAKLLMAIEANRQAVADLPISLEVLSSLRESSRLLSTHYSTQIEGNRLTRKQVADVLHGGTFPHRERDETEVKNYFQALRFLDTLINQSEITIAEQDIQVLHGLVMAGRGHPTPYRDGQNVIKDSNTGAIVYLPTEAKDVAGLMADLIAWINAQTRNKELPVPIVAAIAHYQFATIHPYYDGNGRTARLLTNLVMHKCEYGLKGIYSLEDYYARDLQAYYAALSIGESHNYYFGRINADITAWLVYFCAGMADAFANVQSTVAEAAKEEKADHSEILRELDQAQKQVLSLFVTSKYATTREIAGVLGVQPRTALNNCKKWVAEGFIIQHGAAKKSRRYGLSEKWLELVL